MAPDRGGGCLLATLDSLTAAELDSLDALINRHPTTPHWPDEVRALLEDYLTTLTNHHQIAAWVDSDKAVLNHPQIGARLHHNTERICHAITGSTANGTAATARATAALGSLWRPIRTLSPAQLATHRDALLHTAMAGCTPTNTPARPTAQTHLNSTPVQPHPPRLSDKPGSWLRPSPV